MSQSRVICRIAALVVAGLFTLVGVGPVAAVAGSSTTGSSTTVQQGTQGTTPAAARGEGWCC